MVIDFETTFYFHREGAGVLFGMGDPDEAPTFDTTVQWDFLPKVVDVAVRRLPALGDASISHAWAGLYEVTPDANPIIGPAAGVGGLLPHHRIQRPRISASPAAGRILADLIAGRDPAVRSLAVRSRPIRARHRLGRTLRGVRVRSSRRHGEETEARR